MTKKVLTQLCASLHGGRWIPLIFASNAFAQSPAPACSGNGACDHS